MGDIMIHVAICEDEKLQIEYLVSLLKKWELHINSKWKLSIASFENAEQFIFSLEDQPNYDLMILDIEMGEMNGMELARRIRQDDKNVKIIFITGFKEFVYEGYEVGAIRYMIKPVKENEFYKLMEAVCSDIDCSQKEYFLINFKGQIHKVEFGDILYVEANGHYLALHTVKGIHEWKASLDSVASEFEGHGFSMIRRGLYVNPEHIIRIGREECVLDNDEKLPISKNRYLAINQEFIAYYKRKSEEKNI